MITEDKVIEISYMADEYSKKFTEVRQKYSLEGERDDGRRRRNERYMQDINYRLF